VAAGVLPATVVAARAATTHRLLLLLDLLDHAAELLLDLRRNVLRTTTQLQVRLLRTASQGRLLAGRLQTRLLEDPLQLLDGHTATLSTTLNLSLTSNGRGSKRRHFVFVYWQTENSMARPSK